MIVECFSQVLPIGLRYLRPQLLQAGRVLAIPLRLAGLLADTS